MSGEVMGEAGEIAALRRARAERLARLRAAGGAEEGLRAIPAEIGAAAARTGEALPPDHAGEPSSALDEFLRALGAATGDTPPGGMAEAASLPGQAAEVLPFQRADRVAGRGADRGARSETGTRTGPRAPRSDLDRLPGAGPGLVWALGRAGIDRLAGLAEATPEALSERLGPLALLVDLGGWIRFARAAGRDGAGHDATQGMSLM